MPKANSFSAHHAYLPQPFIWANGTPPFFSCSYGKPWHHLWLISSSHSPHRQHQLAPDLNMSRNGLLHTTSCHSDGSQHHLLVWVFSLVFIWLHRVWAVAHGIFPVAHGFLSGYGAGSAALQHVGASFLSGDQTHISHTGRWTLNHWVPGKFLGLDYCNSLLIHFPDSALPPLPTLQPESNFFATVVGS